MSNTALGWAWQQHAGSAGAKAVLVALAEHADEAGCAWPSQQRLAAMTEQSVRSVARHLAHLEQAGLIARASRSRGRGRGRGTDHYRLCLHPGASQNDAAAAAAVVDNQLQHDNLTGCNAPAAVDNRLQPDTVSPDNLTGKRLQPDTMAGCSPTNPPTCHLQPDTVSGDRTLKEPSTAAAAAHGRAHETPPVDNQQQQRQQSAPAQTPTPAAGDNGSGGRVDARTVRDAHAASDRRLAVDTVVQRLRDRGRLTGDLGPLRAAVAAALQRGCHPEPLADTLVAAAGRAHTPGLLVRIATDAHPGDFPAPTNPADRGRAAAVEQAWRAGREHAYQHGDPAAPRTAVNAVVAALEDTLTAELDSRWPDRRADADLRQAFAVGARFQPWPAARETAADWTPGIGQAWRAEHATSTRRDTGPRPLQAVG